MFERISGCFVLLVLLLDPSSSLQICNIDLQWHEDFLKNQKVSMEFVKEAAEVLLRIFDKNPDLANEYSLTLKFVQQLLHETRPEVISVAYFGATLYLVTVIVTSYCFLVDSQNKLDKALHIENKLDLIIEAEVKPILNHIELLLKNPDTNGLRMVCSKETKVKQMLEDKSHKIQNIADNITILRQQSTEGKEKSRALKITSVVLAGSAIGAVIALAPIAAPASVIVAGGFGVSGYLGYQRFDESENNYDEALSVLKKAKAKAVEAEKAIVMLQTNVELACSLGFKRLESEFKWSLLLEAEEKKEIGSESINHGLKRAHN